MLKLNLKKYFIPLYNKYNTIFIFCPIRKKYILLSKEEWVRQHIIQYLIVDKKYPLISIISEYYLNFFSKRVDLVVFRKEKPIILIECKAPNIVVTKKTFEQTIKYNFIIKSPYLMLSNGTKHVFGYIKNNKKIILIKEIPNYAVAYNIHVKKQFV